MSASCDSCNRLERALAGRDEDVARVRALREVYAHRPVTVLSRTDTLTDLDAALDGPASRLDEGYQPCNHECNGCPTCDPGLTTPPTTDAEEARTDDRM